MVDFAIFRAFHGRAPQRIRGPTNFVRIIDSVIILLAKCFRYWHVLNNDENFMHKVRNKVRTTRLQNFKTQSCLFRFYLTCKQHYCHTARRRGARNLINFIRIDNLLLDRDWLICSIDDNKKVPACPLVIGQKQICFIANICCFVYVLQPICKHSNRPRAIHRCAAILTWTAIR